MCEEKTKNKKQHTIDLRELAIAAIEESNFMSGYFEQYLINRIEKVYTAKLMGKNANKNEAVLKLRKSPAGGRLQKQSFLVGLYSGWSIAMFIFITAMILLLGLTFFIFFLFFFYCCFFLLLFLLFLLFTFFFWGV